MTGPTFLWVIGGVLLFRLARVPDTLVRHLSLLVFRFGLPVVLFFGAARVDYYQLAQARYLLAGLLASLVTAGLAWAWAHLRGWRGEIAAIFTQGAYRANMGVIGIALCAHAYGEEGLALAAPPVALLTITYNLVAVVLLNHAYGKSQSPVSLIKGVASNPLIIGIAAGMAVSLAGIELSLRVRQGGAVFAFALLPLALMCIGASLNLRLMRSAGVYTLEAGFWKLLLMPALAVALAVAMGIHSAELGVLFLLLASPTAAASYIMVMAMGGNGALAANIVVLTTLLSAFSLTLGLAALHWSGLV